MHVVGQCGPKDLPNNVGYCCYIWLSIRTRWQVTLDEDVTYLSCRIEGGKRGMKRRLPSYLAFIVLKGVVQAA